MHTCSFPWEGCGEASSANVRVVQGEAPKHGDAPSGDCPTFRPRRSGGEGVMPGDDDDEAGVGVNWCCDSRWSGVRKGVGASKGDSFRRAPSATPAGFSLSSAWNSTKWGGPHQNHTNKHGRAPDPRHVAHAPCGASVKMLGPGGAVMEKKRKLGVSNTPYDGGWWVTDGGWCVTDGGWCVTDGGWCVIDGGWWVTDGGWCVTDGGWCVTDGGWWVATKHQSVDAIV